MANERVLIIDSAAQNVDFLATYVLVAKRSTRFWLPPMANPACKWFGNSSPIWF